METVATCQVPMFVVGDFNIHFECCDNPNTHQLLDLFEFRV